MANNKKQKDNLHKQIEFSEDEQEEQQGITSDDASIKKKRTGGRKRIDMTKKCEDRTKRKHTYAKKLRTLSTQMQLFSIYCDCSNFMFFINPDSREPTIMKNGPLSDVVLNTVITPKHNGLSLGVIIDKAIEQITRGFKIETKRKRKNDSQDSEEEEEKSDLEDRNDSNSSSELIFPKPNSSGLVEDISKNLIAPQPSKKKIRPPVLDNDEQEILRLLKKRKMEKENRKKLQEEEKQRKPKKTADKIISSKTIDVENYNPFEDLERSRNDKGFEKIIFNGEEIIPRNNDSDEDEEEEDLHQIYEKEVLEDE